jgi:Outer membrane protein beta-barrel domain
MTLSPTKVVIISCFLSGVSFAEDAVRRPSIGLRFQYTQTRPFETSSAEASTTKPIADYNYSATSGSRGLVLTPNVEYRLRPRLTLGLEFQFHHAQYRQVTEIRSGKKDPTLATDDRPVTTVTETTKASNWELPLLARYYGLSTRGIGAKAYLSGGVVFRHISNIRTGTEYSNADGTTDYNEVAAKPDRTNQMGLVAGIGLRFMDDYRIKITPEVRITHWQGTTFSGPAFRSASNQVSVGIGFAY